MTGARLYDEDAGTEPLEHIKQLGQEIEALKQKQQALEAALVKEARSNLILAGLFFVFWMFHLWPERLQALFHP